MISPVSFEHTEGSSPDQPPEDGVALCLSGGGYRAMLFHLGALWRMNELGWLPKLRRVSSVSGGSIAAGILALAWKKLELGADGVAAAFADHVIAPIRTLADRSLQWTGIAGGVLIPGVNVAERLADAYREHVVGETTLQDLPGDDEGPRFVINATNVRTGVLARFSRAYFGEYLLGRIDRPRFPLATVIAASAAFPPFLSPCVLDLSGMEWRPGEGTQEYFRYRDHLVLTDGGVYDNLGLETAFKRYRTLLVSDGGQRIAAEEKPARDWPRHAARAAMITDSQVRSLRRRILIEAYRTGERAGTYFATYSKTASYPLPSPWPVDRAHVLELAAVKTGLVELPPELQERLVNLGYVQCDVAMRSWVQRTAPPPTSLPYPTSGI